MKKLLFAALLTTVLSGCTWFLPAGDPPQGNILENPRGNEVKRSYTLREAVDYLTSMLTLQLMEKCPGERSASMQGITRQGMKLPGSFCSRAGKFPATVRAAVIQRGSSKYPAAIWLWQCALNITAKWFGMKM